MPTADEPVDLLHDSLVELADAAALLDAATALKRVADEARLLSQVRDLTAALTLAAGGPRRRSTPRPSPKVPQQPEQLENRRGEEAAPVKRRRPWNARERQP